MAITHKIIATSFIRGQGVLDISARYALPLTTVENALRVAIRKDTFVPPQQMTIEPQQMTIAEKYGEIEIR